MSHRVSGKEISRGLEIVLIFIIGIGLLLQVIAAITFPGWIPDQAYFIQWMHDVDARGFAYLYQHTNVDYPPVFMFVLYVYGKCLTLLHLIPLPGTHILSKLPSIVFYTLADCFVYLATKSYSTRVRLWVLGLFALNPAILFDTAVWGQVDILDGALMLITILKLGSFRPRFAGVVYALALASKFQSVAVAPAIAVYLLLKFFRGERKVLFRFVAETVLTLLVLFLPFLINGSVMSVLQKAYIHTVGEYPSVSVGAMNIWYYLIGYNPNTSDQIRIFLGITLRDASLCLLALACAYGAYYLLRSDDAERIKLLKAASFLCFSFFLLPTEMHERYNIPTVIISTMVVAYDFRWIKIALVVTMTCLVNLAVVDYGLDITSLGVGVGLLNVVSYLWIAWDLRQHAQANGQFNSNQSIT